MKKGTKILSLAAALTLGVSALAFTGCGESKSYKGEETEPEYTEAMANGGEVSSNGGFVVEKGGFVYFINGVESTTAKNTYGKPEKGSLMRIKKTDLENGDYDKAKIVIPSLFTAQDFNSGLYIYGDYVYYATPTTDKSTSGHTGNENIDFKRAKLDGSERPMSGKYLRLPADATYRFVQVDGVDRNGDGEEDVFCLYEEDGALKSYNTVTKENVTLVKGASSYIYDTKDLTNPNVYYTMSVTYEAEQANPQTPGYNQIYCVDAAARVKSVDKKKASYTVSYSNGEEKTYDFDEKAMKKNAKDRKYDLSDYTSYPYVNLGQLVLDGVGFASTMHTQYNEETEEFIKENAGEMQGYTYTISRYETSGDNVGLYFTRAQYGGSQAAKAFYVEESDTLAEDWNTVKPNADKLTLLDNDATNIPTEGVIMEANVVDGKRQFTYMYTSTKTGGDGATVIYRVTITHDANGQPVSDKVELSDKVLGEDDTASTATKVTLWTTKGNYLYYYKDGVKGQNLLRINYKGEADNYHEFESDPEYKATPVPFLEYGSNWYQPEFVGDILLFANAQNYGNSTKTYNYIYASKIGTTDELLQAGKDYKAYSDYLAEFEETEFINLVNYLFGSGLEVTEEAKAEYIAKVNKENNDENSTEGETFYQAIVDKFDQSKADSIKTAAAYSGCLSRMKDGDVEDINEAWDGLLLYPEEEAKEKAEKSSLWWIWVIVGGVVVIAVVIVAVYFRKKKIALKREADAIVNSYKRQRIDTTDDKTIDVYADENEGAEESAEESVEEPVEEVSEETEAEPVAEEAPAQEPAEAPAEDAEANADSEEKTE